MKEIDIFQDLKKIRLWQEVFAMKKSQFIEPSERVLFGQIIIGTMSDLEKCFYTSYRQNLEIIFDLLELNEYQKKDLEKLIININSFDLIKSHIKENYFVSLSSVDTSILKSLILVTQEAYSTLNSIVKSRLNVFGDVIFKINFQIIEKKRFQIFSDTEKSFCYN